MNKRLAINLVIGIIIAVSVWLGYLLSGANNQVRAQQCWEPGCCGPSLVYNQWSCVSAESSNLCRDLGESPTWVCPGTGATNPDLLECNEICLQACEWRCPLSDWGNHCVVTSGSVACQHPDPGTCTANVYAIQCQSMAGVNDCNSTVSPVDVRQCWVSGGSPPPGEPTPPPGGPTPPPPATDTDFRFIVNSFLDLNENGFRDADEPAGPPGTHVSINIGNVGQSNHTLTVPSEEIWKIGHSHFRTFWMDAPRSGGNCDENQWHIGYCYGTTGEAATKGSEEICRCKGGAPGAYFFANDISQPGILSLGGYNNTPVITTRISDPARSLQRTFTLAATAPT